MAAIMSEIFGDRGKRYLNHMDAETKLIHVRLEAWACWCKDSEARSWPSITLLGRIMEEGAHGARQEGRPPIEIPEAVAITDAAVASLGEVDRNVIKLYYLSWAPKEVLARRCRPKMRVKQFERVIERARWRISGFVTARESLNLDSTQSIPFRVSA